MPVVMANVPLHARPRERLLSCGADGLSERELIALVLRQGNRGESALDLADGLVAECGALAQLSTARPEELARRAGIGEAKAAALVAAFELGRRAALAARDETPLKGPEDVFHIAHRELAGLRRERVLVLVCDSANHLRRTEVVSVGSIDRSALPVREILNCVLRHDGRAFGVAHNHPSGDATPSENDVRSTRDLIEAAKAVGLRFLDHIVVADHEWSRVAT